MKDETKHTGVQCPECKTRLFSYSTHDYKTCDCPNETMIDGGFDYMRSGFVKTPGIVIEHDPELDGPLPKPRYARFPY